MHLNSVRKKNVCNFNHSLSRVLKCYRGELFVSTAVVDVMTGVDGWVVNNRKGANEYLNQLID